MIKTAYRNLIEEHEKLCVALLLLLGCVLRLAALGALPYGLNQDEASAGYEAFALLRSGIDRNGSAWPVLLESWGSGQNALMTYLCIPFVALFGLTEFSVRLPNAICGCLTLFVFWHLARRCRGRYFGITALFLLVLNPWHIMASRWALESNLLPFFLLLGIDLTGLAKTKPWALAGASAAFGLSLYAYGTAFFFLPLYLIFALVWLRRDLRAGPFLVSLALFLLLAAPITLCQLRNMLGQGESKLLFFTLPALTEGRQAATSVFGGASPAENFRDFLRILWTQSDGLIWNSLGFRQGGIFYVLGLPAAAVGCLASLFCRKDRAEEGVMRIALVCALVCAFLIRCNINRINMVWLPLIYFMSVGFHLILSKLGSWATLPAAALLASFLLFFSSYCRTFGGGGEPSYFPGLGAAIEYADGLDAGPVYVTSYVNQPYIFALFYSETSPEDFASTVEYEDGSAAFRQVERFSGFEFEWREKCPLLVLRRGEAGSNKILAEFGDYAVCTAGGI